MEQNQTSPQFGVTSSQSQIGKQVDRPDEVIVNEQEQDKEVNAQDETFEGNEEEKAYSEGNMNNSDTETKPTVQNQNMDNLPGTQQDAEKAAPESTDVE